MVDLNSAFSSAAAGALLGSLSAFAFGVFQQRRDRTDKRHSAVLAAQYALMSQWTITERIRNEHLEPFRADAQRFAKLAIITPLVLRSLFPSPRSRSSLLRMSRISCSRSISLSRSSPVS